MKKFLLIGLLMGGYLCIVSQAWAFIYPDYTGVNAYRADGGYYPHNINHVLTPSDWSSIAFDRDDGHAYEFEVDQPLHIDFLVFDAQTLTGGESNTNETLDFLFILYTEGKIFRPSINQTIFPNVPDTDTLALTSNVHLSKLAVPINNPNHLTGIVYHDQFYRDYTIPFAVDLNPGKYWLAAEAIGGADAAYSNTRFDGYVVPEPSTMLLLGTGLLGAFARRRKRF